jgi:hypothetical protein
MNMRIKVEFKCDFQKKSLNLAFNFKILNNFNELLIQTTAQP